MKLTKAQVRRGIADLRRMRKLVAKGRTVYGAWFVVTADMFLRQAQVAPCRLMLLRHVRPGVLSSLSPQLAQADGIPTEHALKWIDTAIAYAKEHGE